MSGTDRLDRRAIEARTQAIGQELFAAARRHHAHLSVLNQWTARVLSWCLGDPAVKSAVLRLIDVLPSLQTSPEIARHVRDYFPIEELHLPAPLRLGSRAAQSGLLTHRVLASLVTQIVERVGQQFIAQPGPEGLVRTVQQLAERGATCSIDLLGEQVLSESEADDYARQCGALLETLSCGCRGLTVASCGPRANLSVKPSALTPRFDPISPRQSIERAFARLQPLLELAQTHHALVNLDMEQYELRDLTIALAQRALLQASVNDGALGVVIQAYLCDAEETLEALLAWLATHQRRLTIRLVKGAYWDSEVAQAAQRHWPAPVYHQKAETDQAFERLTERLLQARPLVTAAIASHNVRSIAHAMAVAEALGVPSDQLEFQLLYGMGEALLPAITERGYPARVYTPIGALIPGMAYLVRRILENTANESFLRHETFEAAGMESALQAPVQTATPSVQHQPTAAWRVEPLQDFSQAPVRDRMAAALQAIPGRFGGAYPLLVADGAVNTPRVLTVRNPAKPVQMLGTVAQAGLPDVDRAVNSAGASQPAWAQMPVPERVACLRRAAEMIRARRDELAAWVVYEVGKTWREADVEIVETIEYLEYYGQQMLELAAGKPMLQLPGERNQYRYVPRGVAVVIAPWNFPAAILMGMTAAALVSGHAVIVKPAEQSSIVAFHLMHLLREAGVPAGALQLLSGIGEEIGAALVQHPGVQLILFTGSKAVGSSIIKATVRLAPGQRSFKHAVVEMGGKNAIIIDRDADLDAAVAGAVQSAFGYAGQKCSAASRLIVHEAVYDRFASRLAAATDRLMIGDPSDPATDIGPLIDETAQQRLVEAAAHAARAGSVVYRYPSARVPTSGHFVGPMLALDVPRQDRLAREELFGPLVCVFRVKTFDEALALANDTDYALTGGVYSRSPANLQRAMRAFDVGNLYLNRPITGAMVGRQPFGGHRMSGLGTKAGGPDYLLHCLIPKTICTNTARHGMPLE